MAPPKGSHNNPNGRPAKSRALTDSLTLELNKSIDVEGKKLSGKKVLASLIAMAITTGRMKFPNDKEESIISIKDWIEFVKWVYERVDGKPVQPIGGDGDAGEIVLHVVYDHQEPPING